MRSTRLYHFQLGPGVAIMARRPAAFTSAPSQSLIHLPNGFSVCCFVAADDPACVWPNSDLIPLLCDIISHWNCSILGIYVQTVNVQQQCLAAVGAGFLTEWFVEMHGNPGTPDMCLQPVNQTRCCCDMFYYLFRVSWGKNWQGCNLVSTSCPVRLLCILIVITVVLSFMTGWKTIICTWILYIVYEVGFSHPYSLLSQAFEVY